MIRIPGLPRPLVSALALSALFPVAAQAGIIQFQKGEYGASAFAQAHTVTDQEQYQDTSTSETFSIGADATATYSDGGPEDHFAYGAGSISWSVTHNGNQSTLKGGAGGVAEGRSFGLETAASGNGSIKLYFDLTYDANIDLVYDGTYGSELYRFEGGEWVQVYYLSAYETFGLTAGSYRLDSGAGESITGYNYYSSGIFYTMTAVPVPEPATLALALAGGAVVLARRRLRR